MSRIINGPDRLVISPAILDELLAVLARKFSRDAEELSRLAIFLTDLSDLVQPRSRLRLLADDPDNRILECAITGNADLLVTGDHAILKLRRHGATRIVALRDYLRRFR